MYEYEGMKMFLPFELRDRICDIYARKYIFYYSGRSGIFDDDLYTLYNGKGASRKEYRGFCTACMSWVDLPQKPEHKESGNCPECLREIQFRAGGRGRKNMRERQFIRMFDVRKNKQEVVLYEVFIDREDYSGFEDSFAPRYEDIRIGRFHSITPDGWESYDMIDGRAHKRRKAAFYTDCTIFGQGFGTWGWATREVFGDTDDMSEVLGTFLRYKLECVGENGAMLYNTEGWHILESLLRWPFLEQIKKAGYFRLFVEIARSGRGSPYLNLKAKTWDKLIRCGDKAVKAKLRELVRLDKLIDTYQLERAEKLFRAFDDFLPEYAVGLDRNREEAFAKLPEYGMKKKFNYLKSRDPLTWLDYLRMCREMNVDLTKKANAFPKDLTLEHDRLAERLKMQRYSKSEPAIRAIYEKLSRSGINGYSFGRLTASVPTCASDIISEGEQMHNCVATYIEKHAEGRSTIMFIRHKDNPEKSFFTLEIEIPDGKSKNKAAFHSDEPRIIQCYGERNRVSCGQNAEVAHFVEKFKKHINYCLANKRKAEKYHGKDIRQWTKSQQEQAVC